MLNARYDYNDAYDDIFMDGLDLGACSLVFDINEFTFNERCNDLDENVIKLEALNDTTYDLPHPALVPNPMRDITPYSNLALNNNDNNSSSTTISSLHCPTFNDAKERDLANSFSPMNATHMTHSFSLKDAPSLHVPDTKSSRATQQQYHNAQFHQTTKFGISTKPTQISTSLHQSNCNNSNCCNRSNGISMLDGSIISIPCQPIFTSNPTTMMMMNVSCNDVKVHHFDADGIASKTVKQHQHHQQERKGRFRYREYANMDTKLIKQDKKQQRMQDNDDDDEYVDSSMVKRRKVLMVLKKDNENKEELKEQEEHEQQEHVQNEQQQQQQQQQQICQEDREEKEDDDEESGNYDEKGHLKGSWFPEEDELLQQYVREAGEYISWKQISIKMKTRNPKQCRERWTLNLNPNINHGPFTKEEDKILLKAYAELGPRWTKIKAYLPGRTENSVKTRYKSVINRMGKSMKHYQHQHQQEEKRWIENHLKSL